MNQPLLQVNGVWKRLCRRPEKALRYALGDIGREIFQRQPGEELRDGEFWALRNVDFEIEPGEVIGIIGHNGAGKSTLINIVSGVIRPTLGSVVLHTPRVALIDHGGGLNPIETGRENALTQLALHGVPEEAVADELRAVEAFADIGDFIDAPVGTYSLGMRLRLAFSVFSRLKPDLFIIDEALGGGDDRFRNRFRAYLRQYVDSGGAMLLCSHEMLAIQSFCDRCLLLDRGRVIMSGPPVMMIDSYHALSQERERHRARAEAEMKAESSDGVVPGEQRCRIESVAVISDVGGDVRPGSAVTIEVSVAVTEEIDGVACGIEIGRGDFVSLATLAGGYPAVPFALRPPSTILQCRIDRLPLAPGGYDIRASVTLPESSVSLALVGYRDPAIPFTVGSGIDETTNLARVRENVIHMPTKWSVKAVTPGEALVD